MLEAFLSSTTLVAISEIGDKTQLLALVLAARFRKATPIIAGIFVATVANHALAAYVGQLLAGWLTPTVLKWTLAVSFFAMAAWALVPDTLSDEDAQVSGRSAFMATVVAFFLAEIGDKTQIATVMLAAKYSALTAVVLGTTLGMMLANVPAVLFGKVAAERIPFRLVRLASAALFVMLGVAVLIRGLD